MESAGEAATTLIAKVPLSEIHDVVAPVAVQPSKAAEAPAAEKDATKGDQAQTGGDEDDADGAEADAGSDAGEQASEDAAHPKKKGGFQRKIEARDREIAELRRANAEKDELLRLALKKEGGEASPKKAADEDPKPQRDQFDSYEDFTEALGEWSGRQGFRREDARRAEAQQKASVEQAQAKAKEALGTALDGMMKRGAEKFTDFATSVQDPSLPISQSLAEALAESELGEDVLYHLVKNRDDLLRIAQLSPLAQARAIGALEASLKATARGQQQQPPAKKQTSAPSPANTSTPGRVASLSNHARENLSNADYQAMRKAEGATFGRR